MRLINAKTLQLEEFMGASSPPYAILSHTWEVGQEVSFQEFVNPHDRTAAIISKKGFAKIQEACRLSLEYGFEWCWVDTCCIDKTSSAELSEAINSMFWWYEASGVCLAYLSDLNEPESFDACRWFTRGWTLQELIAPEKVYFFDASWLLVGEKRDLEQRITNRTGICESVLRSRLALPSIAVATRLSWAATRETTRVEDMAYCLMGLFDVNMPMLYGEGSKAFLRLQEEIMKTTNDLSLFAWRDIRNDDDSSTTYSGILASSPAVFAGEIFSSTVAAHKFNSEFSITNRGIRFTTPLLCREGGDSGLEYLLPLTRITNGAGDTLAVCLRKYGPDLFARQQPNALPATRAQRWYRRVPPRTIYITRETSTALEQYVEQSRKYAFHFRFSHDFEVVNGSPDGLWDVRNRLVLTLGEYAPCWGALRLAWIPPSSSSAAANKKDTVVEVVVIGILSHILGEYEPRCYLLSLEVYNEIPSEVWEQDDGSELAMSLIKNNDLKDELDVDGGLMKYTLSATIVEERVPKLSGDVMFCVDVVGEPAGTKIRRGYINSFSIEKS